MHLFIGAAARRCPSASDWKDLRGPFISAALEAGGSRILSTAGRKIRYRFPSSKLSTRHVWEVTRGTPYGIRERGGSPAVLRSETSGPGLVCAHTRYVPALHTLYLRSTYVNVVRTHRDAIGFEGAWTISTMRELKPQLEPRFLANVHFVTRRNSVISFPFSIRGFISRKQRRDLISRQIFHFRIEFYL